MSAATVLAGLAITAALLYFFLIKGRDKSARGAVAVPKAQTSSRRDSPVSRTSPASTAPSVPQPAQDAEFVDKFRGGMLFPQPSPCDAVVLLRGKTFPEGRIPSIPVPGCDRETCQCQVHTVVGRRRSPRRVRIDRREDVRMSDDRRSGDDRRHEDPYSKPVNRN